MISSSCCIQAIPKDQSHQVIAGPCNTVWKTILLDLVKVNQKHGNQNKKIVKKKKIQELCIFGISWALSHFRIFYIFFFFFYKKGHHSIYILNSYSLNSASHMCLKGNLGKPRKWKRHTFSNNGQTWIIWSFLGIIRERQTQKLSIRQYTSCKSIIYHEMWKNPDE